MDPKLEQEGRVWIRHALDEEDLSSLDQAIEAKCRPGVRLEWNDHLTFACGESSRLTKLAHKLLPGALPVRIVIFNKSGSVNWQVPWHQDRVIAVREKHSIPNFDRWTKKSGVWHVEPPIDLLKKMLFARVHLDDSTEDNGCLELALGTHHHGLVRVGDAAALAEAGQTEVCCAQRGDVIFVKALVLHRSKPSRQEGNRRTLRIDYAAERLPEPLEWAF